MTTVIVGPTAPPVLPPGAGGANLVETDNPDNPGGAGGVGVLDTRNLGAGARVGRGLAALGTLAELRTLTAGANVTLTQGPETIEIAAAGGGGAPAAPDTSVQFNDGGAFGGNANVLIDGATGVLTSAVAVTTPQVRVADADANAFSVVELVSGDSWYALDTTATGQAVYGRAAANSQHRFVTAGTFAVQSQAGFNHLAINTTAGTTLLGIADANATAMRILEQTGLDVWYEINTLAGEVTYGTQNASNSEHSFRVQGTSAFQVATVGGAVYMLANTTAFTLRLSAANTAAKIEMDGAGPSIQVGDVGALLAVFGETPVIRQTALATTAGFSAGIGTGVNDDSTFTGGLGATAYTIGDVIRILKLYGWLVA